VLVHNYKGQASGYKHPSSNCSWAVGRLWEASTSWLSVSCLGQDKRQHVVTWWIRLNYYVFVLCRGLCKMRSFASINKVFVLMSTCFCLKEFPVFVCFLFVSVPAPAFAWFLLLRRLFCGISWLLSLKNF